MTSRRSLTGTLTAVAVLGAGLAGIATPAQAAPVEAAGKKVASCVKTKTFNQASVCTVQVRNTCKSAVKVKIVMRLGKDSPCTTIKKGGYYHRNTKGLATWKATVKC
ncbi:hypothetical protein [Streptomyces diastaticus]|uniref:hypothetical protein n=1 Tax=Streptomyces diastaticus TaxID=1956 RepID=UPI0035D9AEA6